MAADPVAHRRRPGGAVASRTPPDGAALAAPARALVVDRRSDTLVIAVLVGGIRRGQHFRYPDHGPRLSMRAIDNYYRWPGTPEAPSAGTTILLALWAHVSTASIWMRLPTLAMALTCWWVISREAIPPSWGTLSRRAGQRADVYGGHVSWPSGCCWTTAWPEPIIALGILLTWCSVERAVATSRLRCRWHRLHHRCLDPVLRGRRRLDGALLVAIGPLRTIPPAFQAVRRATTGGADPGRGHVTAIPIFRDQTFAARSRPSSSSVP